MKTYLIAILATISLAFTNHNTPMAFFDLTVLENTIEMQIEVEEAAMEQAIEIQYMQAISDELVAQYLLEHTKWTVNETASPMSIQTIEKERGHFRITAQLNTNSKVKTLGIYNDCLIEAVEGHHNIIRLQYGERLREFGLNKDRTETKIVL